MIKMHNSLMGLLDNKKQTKRKSTKGFSELNKRTYEASPAAQQNRYNSSYISNNNIGKSSQKYNNTNHFYRNNQQFHSSADNNFINNRYAQVKQPVNNNYAINNNAVNNPNHSLKNQYMNNTSDYSRSSIGNKYSRAAKKQRFSKRNKIILIVALAIFAALLFSFVAFAAMINSNLNEGMENINLTQTSLNEPFYMVLMGVDSSEDRKSDGSTDNDFRSDSIILARIDPKDVKVSLISLHRDIEVDMGEYGTQKLNAAHSLGGPQLVVDTVSKLAGVSVSHYAEINFEGFESAVNDLGGVEVDVPMDIYDPYAGIVYKGYQVLNGEDALTLCRSRHAYDDYGDGDTFRAANQRLVLSSIAKKLLESDIGTIAKTITDLSQYIKTDLVLNDIIGLAQRMKDIDISKDVYSAMTPTEGVYKDGGWYEVLDQDKWETMMKRMDEGLPPSTETIIDDNTGVVLSYSGDKNSDSEASNEYSDNYSGTVAVRNGTDKEGVAASASNKISSMGFTTDIGNANTSDYTTTVIVYSDDSNKSSAEAIKNKLGCGKIIKNDNEYSFNTDILVVIGTDYTV